MNKKGQWWIVPLFIIGIIAIVTLGYMIKAGIINFGFKQQMAQIDSAGRIIDKTYDAENAIYNYEWFKTQYEKILAAEKQINNTAQQVTEFKEMYGDPKEWEWSIQEEYSRLSATFLGQKNHYEQLVAEYNARSQMANRNIFQDKLPFNVDKKIW